MLGQNLEILRLYLLLTFQWSFYLSLDAISSPKLYIQLCVSELKWDVWMYNERFDILPFQNFSLAECNVVNLCMLPVNQDLIVLLIINLRH